MAAATPMDRLGPGSHACVTSPDLREQRDAPAARARGQGIACRTKPLGLDLLGAALPERDAVRGARPSTSDNDGDNGDSSRSDSWDDSRSDSGKPDATLMRTLHV